MTDRQTDRQREGGEREGQRERGTERDRENEREGWRERDEIEKSERQRERERGEREEQEEGREGEREGERERGEKRVTRGWGKGAKEKEASTLRWLACSHNAPSMPAFVQQQPAPMILKGPLATAKRPPMQNHPEGPPFSCVSLHMLAQLRNSPLERVDHILAQLSNHHHPCKTP